MKINDENFYSVLGWMINRLNLKGVKLCVFAIIYGFTQDGVSRFKGSKKYLEVWSNAGETAVKNALRDLTGSGLILKYEVKHKFGTVNEYAANIAKITKARKGGQKVTRSESDPGQKVTKGGSESDPGGGQKVTKGGSESDPIYNSYNIEGNKGDMRGENTPSPFTADAISDYDKQALPTPEFLSSPQSETEKRKKVPAKKEKEKLPLRKIEAAVLDWLRGEGKEDWNYAARGYIGTDSQKEKEVGMCLANMEKKQSYRLQKTAEMPATIISELVMWYGNQYVKARGQNSLTNANSSATGRKTQNNEYLIDAQTAATALQNYRARRGTESGAGYGTD